MYSVEGRQLLSVDFGSSLNKAVLKLYPADDEDSTESSVCLKFNAHISSSAVQLLIAVISVAENTIDDTISKLYSDGSEINRQKIGTGRQSITVLRGRQYVEITAVKIKVTRISDRVAIHAISYSDGACRIIRPGK